MGSEQCVARTIVLLLKFVKLILMWQIHCNIHRKSLISKSLSVNFISIFNTSVKIANFIKTRPLQSHLFENLCEILESIHKSLLLYMVVCWLSREKVLVRLVELLKEVTSFLYKKNNYGVILSKEKFIIKLLYMTYTFKIKISVWVFTFFVHSFIQCFQLAIKHCILLNIK